MIPFLREKTGEKQNSATAMISVDGIVTIISNEVKITRESFKNILKVKNFLKNLINLIETNHQINMTSDHSVWSNISFESHLNAKSFNVFLTLYQLCEARWFYFNACCKDDVISTSGVNWKEPSSSTLLPELLFNGDNNEETLM